MMKNISRSLVSILLIFLIAIPSTAFADAAAAQVFYENAAKEYGKGNYGQAAELLYKAYVNDANLIYAYNRILALQADKQYVEALKELNVFEDQMMKDPEKRFEDVPQIKTKLEEQVKAAAAVNVKDPDEKKDPVIKDPDKTKLDPEEGDNKVQPIPDSGDMNSMEVLGLTVAGAGTIPLAVGILFLTGLLIDEDLKNRVLSVQELSEGDLLGPAVTSVYPAVTSVYGTECEGGCLAQYNEEKEDHEFNATLGFVLTGVGSALVIGGGILYLVSGDKASDENASNFKLSPYVTPTGAGAGFSLDF